MVDHIYPVSKGGKADYHNLITSCNKCNDCKGDRVFPINLLFRFWNIANGYFSYKETKRIWEQDLKYRTPNRHENRT